MLEGVRRTLRVRYGANGIRDWFNVMLGHSAFELMTISHLRLKGFKLSILTFVCLPYFIITGLGLKRYPEQTYYLKEDVVLVYTDFLSYMRTNSDRTIQEMSALIRGAFIPERFFLFGDCYAFQDRMEKYFNPESPYMSLCLFLAHEAKLITEKDFEKLYVAALDLDNILYKHQASGFVVSVLNDFMKGTKTEKDIVQYLFKKK